MKNLIENVCYLSSLDTVIELYGLFIDVERVYNYDSSLKSVRLRYSFFYEEGVRHLNFTREMLESISLEELKGIVETHKEKVISSNFKG